METGCICQAKILSSVLRTMWRSVMKCFVDYSVFLKNCLLLICWLNTFRKGTRHTLLSYNAMRVGQAMREVVGRNVSTIKRVVHNMRRQKAGHMEIEATRRSGRKEWCGF